MSVFSGVNVSSWTLAYLAWHTFLVRHTDLFFVGTRFVSGCTIVCDSDSTTVNKISNYFLAWRCNEQFMSKETELTKQMFMVRSRVVG